MIGIVAAYILVTSIMMNKVRDHVIENNAEIENIVTINRLGSWGELFREYVLVVEIDGQKFRIWTNYKGEVTDKEALY